jgi:hypothetical protein
VKFVHIAAIVFLSALSVVFAAGILYGEATDQWYLGGGTLVGALLIAYSVIVLVLRKMGLVGPRKAER